MANDDAIIVQAKENTIMENRLYACIKSSSEKNTPSNRRSGKSECFRVTRSDNRFRFCTPIQSKDDDDDDES